MVELCLGAFTAVSIGSLIAFTLTLGPVSRADEEESIMLGIGDVVWHGDQWVEIVGFTQVEGVTRVRVRAVRHG